MNQAAQHSGQAIDRFLAEEEEQAREANARVKQEPLSGRIHHDQPFGGQERAWAMARAGEDDSMDNTIDDSSFVRPQAPARRNVPMSQTQNTIHEAWSSHPSIAARTSYDRAPSVAFDPENQPDQKPILGWYDSNPGEEALKQLATMQSRLNQRLGPEYISTRPGGAGVAKLSYIEGWKAIDLANEVFGFNGWSTTIRKLETDFMDVSPDGRVNCGITAMVRVSLRDGTFHDDVGYGHCENIKGKYMALEKAKKEAVTDAMKRALRTFGRLMGNCVYDRKYVTMVNKMTPREERFDVSDMHRRNDPNAPAVGSASGQQQQAQQARPQAQPAQPQPQPQQQPQQQAQAAAQPTAPRPSTSATTPATASPAQSTTTTTTEEQERIRAERQALAAQRQAAFRQRQEEQKREAAAALERQKGSTSGSAGPSNGNPTDVKTGTASPTSTISPPSSSSSTTTRAPPRLRRAPAAPLPADPAPTVSDHPASRVFAKEPGAKWAQRASAPAQQPAYDESDLSAIADSWDGGLSQEAKVPNGNSAIITTAKRLHESPTADRQPLRNRENEEGGGEAKRRRV